MKAIADKEDCHEESSFFHYYTYEYREQILLAMNFE